MTKTQERTVARLKRKLKRLHITQEQVAAEAKDHRRPRGVDRTSVVKVLGGKLWSSLIVDAARRMIIERISGDGQSA